MIATFPEFTPLTQYVQKDIEQLTAPFEPYSDFNFTSLFCWNTDGSTSVATINHNLVIKLPDYITGEPVYSILGKHQLDDSIRAVLQTTDSLELVPEEVVQKLSNPNSLLITETPDQFDYIYSLDDHAHLPGGQFKSKRKHHAKFARNHEDTTVLKQLDLSNTESVEQIRLIFHKWTLQKNTDKAEAEQEMLALDRLINFSDMLNVSGYIVIINGHVAGFSVVEVISKEFAIYHFQKTLQQYEHLDIYLTKVTSKHLHELGCKYINWEQDLGIEGLRIAKTNYKPTKVLKKYSVKLRH